MSPDLYSLVAIRVQIVYKAATPGGDNYGLAVLQLQTCSSLLSPVARSVLRAHEVIIYFPSDSFGLGSISFVGVCHRARFMWTTELLISLNFPATPSGLFIAVVIGF